MDRTYDVFADNGLFILSYYLEKDVEDITLEDIENSVGFMSEKVEEFLDCPKYTNLKTMFLFNSAVSNPSLKNVKLETVLQEFLSQKGEDYCMICGQNYANVNINLKGRSYLPNRPGATYFNFSNNLHNINVCPYCLLLTTYSVMNCRVNNHAYLYNSSDNEFMEDFTYRRQDENKQDIALQAAKPKKSEGRLELLLEMLNFNRVFDSQVEIYRFNNGKEEDIADSEQIYSRNIKLLRKMSNKSLLSEFRSLNLTWMIVEDKLNLGYLNYIYDFNKEELKCSKELYDFLNKEVNMLDDKTIELIKRITESVTNAKLDVKKIRNNFRSVINIKSYDNALMELFQMYYEQTEEQLFNEHEYNELTDIRKYNRIKNMIIIGLI